MDGDDNASPNLVLPQPSQHDDTQEFYDDLEGLLLLARNAVPREASRPFHGYISEDDDAYGDGGFGAVPASGVAIAGLPETTVGKSEARGKGCAVCFEGYEAGDTLRTMPCSHDFHEYCIFRWLCVSRLCPLCRSALPADAETESDMEEEDDSDDGDGEEQPTASVSSSSDTHGGMEVGRLPEGFRLPHEMTGIPGPAPATGPPTRMRSAAHEFYHRSTTPNADAETSQAPQPRERTADPPIFWPPHFALRRVNDSESGTGPPMRMRSAPHEFFPRFDFDHAQRGRGGY